MAKKHYLTLVFLILFKILQNVRSENDSFNPFGSKLNKKSNLQNTELTTDKIIEDPAEEKIIEKRRLLFKDKDMNFLTTTEGEQFENNEYSARRRTNFSETENVNEVSENYQEYNNWENERNKFSFPLHEGNARNLGETHSRQSFTRFPNPNQAYHWENKNVFEKSHPRWNEEKNYKPFSNSQWDAGANWNNNERTSGIINENEKNAFSDEKNSHAFNRRVSITTLNNANMGNVKDYNRESVSDMHSGYMGHSNKNYHNTIPQGFWNPNFYKPEKGVIINFNTECPTPRQFNNQLVHKFIFTPKSPINTQSEDSSFQIPETALISPHRMGSLYYL